ncbi:MAG TPA: nuclear transport factor 2 family protein [Gemmatimonadales bacterium]|nr:nuclear transport factor 2 family protein [Gemmatimonadales bacterium]
MPHVRLWSGFALLVVSAAACAPKEPAPIPPPAIDSTKVRAGVDDLWRQWVDADTAGNLPAMSALVDDSIRIDSKGGPPIEGKAAYQSFAETMLKGTDVLTEVITPDQTVVVSNELAYQNGNYVETTMSAKKKKIVEYGRYAAAIRLGADGKWRIRYIMAFSDSSVAAK